MTTSEMTPADFAAITNNNDGMGFGGNGAWWLIVLLLFWGRGGYGGYGGDGGTAAGYTLASDFATIQRQLSDGFGGVEKGLDTIRNGLCDGFYTNAQLINGVNTNIMQGTNALATQIADCCCKTQSGIERVNTNNAMNTAAITGAIKDCCCDTEKQFMQTRFDNAQATCTTLQAIDKVGDRIIGHFENSEKQKLLAENNDLRMRDYFNQFYGMLRPAPVPAFNVPAPFFFGNGYGRECNGPWN